ncbi:MAG: hypothetical protein KBF73_05255 [Flavobacteriales bacterium]|nr:hypothetical protein [Flavobacteriales bacterium]
MKNLFVYYLVILAPVGLLIWLNKTDMVSANLWVGLFFVYLLIYRTYVDGKRLSDKGVIPKKDIWKMIIPGARFKHFKELYLK